MWIRQRNLSAKSAPQTKQAWQLAAGRLTIGRRLATCPTERLLGKSAREVRSHDCERFTHECVRHGRVRCKRFQACHNTAGPMRSINRRQLLKQAGAAALLTPIAGAQTPSNPQI